MLNRVRFCTEFWSCKFDDVLKLRFFNEPGTIVLPFLLRMVRIIEKVRLEEWILNM